MAARLLLQRRERPLAVAVSAVLLHCSRLKALIRISRVRVNLSCRFVSHLLIFTRYRCVPVNSAPARTIIRPILVHADLMVALDCRFILI